MPTPPDVVDRETWLEARKELLEREKAMSRQLDELAAARRQLPWVRVDTDYAFETESGTKRLAQLFDGREQLVLWHFMYGPDWDEGCPSCSFWADTYDGTRAHLAARDATLVVCSRAPLEQLSAYRARMGWEFPWVSSLGSTFNQDFGVSFPDGGAHGATYNFGAVTEPMEEHHGLSIFALDDAGDVHHTYSTYGRGVDILNNTYMTLDLTPKGRDEDRLEWSMAWLRRRDSYDE